MLILKGCVQPGIAPQFNASTARILDKIGISLIHPTEAGCCGAVSLHLSATEEALRQIRRNIDVMCEHLDQGAEAIISTSSACALTMKDYETLLGDDEVYAKRAARVSSAVKDVVEVLSQELPEPATHRTRALRVAFHAPCTLQHGQKLSGVVERLLIKQGFILEPVTDAHLCCGSAGTYSILQPDLSATLLDNKLTLLTAGKPDVIATANIGCYTQLMSRAEIPVVHWVELLDET